MSDSIAVIVPAAGKSTRFGGREKKPFVSLDGRPIWLRSAEMFWKRDDVSKVYLVIAPNDREEFRGRFGHLLAFANAEVVAGGDERFDSVANALALIPDSVELVAIHDAVRPLTPHSLIDDVFSAAKKHGAAMLAMPVADTLKHVDAATNRITRTVPREGLWMAQTPQVFRRDLIVAAYAKRKEINIPITDDAQLVEAQGYEVVVVRGSPANFKITAQEDIELAEAILKARGSKAAATRPGPAFDDEVKW
jgi:2-C-methyl-D-erythritol 4-phosphate cytidylyltransferase